MKKNIILSSFIFIVLIAVIINPSRYIETSINAIEIWAKILLPSLLPFFILTKILTNLGQVQNISKMFSPITSKFYRTSPICSYIFFMSILTGYPVGSKLTADLYNNNQISLSDAKRVVCFSSNSGPMFIIGSVGIGMLSSVKIGYIIYFSHIIGALLNGLLYRNIIKGKQQYNYQVKKEKVENILSSSVLDSIFSILLIGGIIVLMFVIIQVLIDLRILSQLTNVFNLIGLNINTSESLSFGVLEMTKACLNVASSQSTNFIKIVVTNGLIAFGGFSTILQSMAFLNKIVSTKFFVLQKITHTICSTIVCVIICLVMKI